MDVTRTPDAEAAAQRAAQVLAELAGAARTVRGRAHVCLAGGSSPMRAYDLLGPRLDDWTDIHLWYGDERCVPHDHPDSNHGQALARLVAPGATWHPVDTALEPQAAAAAYAAELGDTVMDVTLLGIGPDGHTASLFPDHPLLDAEGTVAAITDSPKPPPQRVTLTLGALNASRRIVLLVTGTEKADALARILAGPDRAAPAPLLERERLEVVADAAALGD
jgi:6-phosphogluconolactonase